ncbi:hypothetical protein QTN23_26630 [Pseudomonas shirazica]|uniref:hypothetical protein n=1 Tax=Pseudomonas shirazica TaxID=1940636 RepID=UPI0025A9943D|nr:hypothetical protein [Pseudomonas shirazica]MDM9601381.1 hypothetical protein [Pseudomonas shirazica]MDM9601923.1 hypothetical protein [Pseudomonas shirazica]MDO2414766.1 hypothetical protein [Pseudomonas shirazica]MDO2416449.1 hypothetical protein [Pseudomonas shirazica]
MTTPMFPSLVDDQVAEVVHAVPDDRILMVFKGLTMEDAMNQARLAHIENPAAWSGRAYLCGICTLAYEVRA